MNPKERDMQILEHIIKYSEEIEETIKIPPSPAIIYPKY